jgi:catalase
MEFIQNQYRHCKAILAFGASAKLLDKAGVSLKLSKDQPDPGLMMESTANVEMAAEAFIQAISQHRHPERETDPPLV